VQAPAHVDVATGDKLFMLCLMWWAQAVDRFYVSCCFTGPSNSSQPSTPESKMHLTQLPTCHRLNNLTQQQFHNKQQRRMSAVQCLCARVGVCVSALVHSSDS